MASLIRLAAVFWQRRSLIAEDLESALEQIRDILEDLEERVVG